MKYLQETTEKHPKDNGSVSKLIFPEVRVVIDVSFDHMISCIGIAHIQFSHLLHAIPLVKPDLEVYPVKHSDHNEQD